jgi:HTH-type transcriptional regulator / antitoxin HipB
MSYYVTMEPNRPDLPDVVDIKRTDDIATLIRTRREALGLSQQVLAERLTVSRKWVNEIEGGHANAKLGLVLRALNELGIDLIAHRPRQLDTGRETEKRPKNRKVDSSVEIDIDEIANMGLRSQAPATRRGG